MQDVLQRIFSFSIMVDITKHCDVNKNVVPVGEGVSYSVLRLD